MTLRWLARLLPTLGLVVPFLFGVPQVAAAQSQESDPADTTQDEIARAEEEGLVRLTDEVSVTGSLIPREDLSSLSPVAVVNPEEITYQGTARMEDLVQALPQVFASQNSTLSNGATGTATVDLRYLGSVRTLALINGRRMSAGTAWETAPDLNFIPAALVQRVDVLTGGASTVYGADAVAGVVNFILDTEFEGVRGGIQYNGFQHNNNNSTAQDMNAAKGFPVVTGSTWDTGGWNANLAVGGKFAGNKGHATAYLDYRSISAIWKEARDYTNCSPSRGSDGPVCGGSPTIPEGRFISYDKNWNFHGDYVLDMATGNTFKAREGEVFNYGPYNFMQRPDTKWGGGGFARYTINEHFEPYAEVMFMDDYTDAQIAPTGNFGRTAVINCDNPMLSAQQRDAICTSAGFGPNDYANVLTLRRNVEGGPRVFQLRHTSWRLLGGVRGDIAPGWSWDLFGLQAEVSSPQSYINDFHTNRIGDAMDVVGDPNDPSTWECRSGNAGCAPWNIFTAGGVTQAAIDYMSTDAILASGTKSQMVNLTITGDLERHGVMLPSASEGVQVAVGAAYRKESLFVHPDEVNQLAHRAGTPGEMSVTDGGYDVKELFVEGLVPLVQDTTGFQDLSLELGYRYANYNLAGTQPTWKVMASWAPANGLRFRGGLNRAVRAPNVRELFLPQTYGLGGNEDICANDPATGVPSATRAQCLNTGVSAAQYGTVVGNPAGQYNTFWGGNPELDVETANTYTFGLVWTPQNITGLSVTLDYYDIKVEDGIFLLSADDIIKTCAETGDALLCSLIHRDPAGTLWLTEAGYTETTAQNIAELGARGLDISANYPVNLGDSGYISLSMMATHLLESSWRDPLINYDCVGFYGNQCRQPQPKWRHRVRASWQSSFNTTISLGWRYIGGVLIDDASENPDLANPGLMESWTINGADKNDAYNYLDLHATYAFSDGLRATVGVNNLLDVEPPLGPSLSGNDYGPGWYGNYDPLGRTILVSFQFEF